MKNHPFHELLQKTDQTDMEKVALYGVMRTSTSPDFAHLTPEETWDRMVQEYDNLKMLAHFEGVPQDTQLHVIDKKDVISVEYEFDETETGEKIDDLLAMPPRSFFKN